MLRLHIDGAWEPADFIDALQSVESMYYKITLSDYRWADPDFDPRWYRSPFRKLMRNPRNGGYGDDLQSANDWLLADSRMRADSDRRVYVRSISYASPGGIDFAGLGQAMEAVDRTVGRLIDFFTEREKRRQEDKQAAVETEMKRQTLRAMEIENARAMLSLRRDFHGEIDQSLIPLFVQDQEKLVPLITQGKLIGVERREADDADKD